MAAYDGPLTSVLLLPQNFQKTTHALASYHFDSGVISSIDVEW